MLRIAVETAWKLVLWPSCAEQLVPISLCPGSAMPLSPAAWLAREAERSGGLQRYIEQVLNVLEYWGAWYQEGCVGFSLSNAMTVGWDKMVWGQLGWISNRHSFVPWMVWYNVFYSHLSISLIS